MCSQVDAAAIPMGCCRVSPSGIAAGMSERHFAHELLEAIAVIGRAQMVGLDLLIVVSRHASPAEACVNGSSSATLVYDSNIERRVISKWTTGVSGQQAVADVR
jgi:hypothetical protein